MSPEHAKFLAGIIGQQLQMEWMLTVKVIEAIPESKKNWKPEEKSRTAWDIATHVAMADVGFLQAVVANDFNGQFPAKVKGSTIAEVAEWYKHEMPKNLERALALDGVHLATPIQAPWGMKMPAVTFMNFCNLHMVHHRGQLSAYLRPMGGKVPSIYGGSADEPYKA